ncbi:MAG TPA: patatin-like phospholipase family protein [Thermoanaerobaculia bacterium]|nr:patatin-like phospholipase family protein [Thermoanaerobaculia bacterium]
MPNEIDKEGSSGPRIGLALAGGGPEGAVYELGVLLALKEALGGLPLNRLHVYVGVSSGAFVASCLANGFTVEEMARVLSSSRSAELGRHPFHTELFFMPARSEYLRRIGSVPRLVRQALTTYLTRPGDLSILGSLFQLGQALPVGLFDNEPMRRYLAGLFADQGGEDDFRRLASRLRIVAADLDSGEAVVFGREGFDHVPISRAVQASTALPGLYPPVEIDGRWYVDGVLLKTLHASVALEEGAELLFCVNPIVPVDTVRAVEDGAMRRGKLVHRGLPTVLSQTFRTLIRSRLGVGMKAYETTYPDADVVLLEPHRDDYTMFFTNVFSFSERRAVLEHAYQQTRADLLRRSEELAPVLARHGLTLKLDVLEDPERTPWQRLEPVPVRMVRKPGEKLPEVDRLDRALERLEGLL